MDIDRVSQLSRFGLGAEANWNDVKKAYRQLMQEWHPDRFTNDPDALKKAETRSKELNEAYELLKICYVSARVERLSMAIRRTSRGKLQEMFRAAAKAQENAERKSAADNEAVSKRKSFWVRILERFQLFH